MFTDYIHYLLAKAAYEKDENGYIVASVPGYQGFFSQGQNIEEARENLVDAIEGVVFHKIQHNDKKIIKEIKTFISKQNLQYA
ncbi:MAG: type II toxin-antitoxin system HicB family antitoxin [Candidatus Absconditabacteria bacterium]|nr:type II toxin-antitoxin system HicB family antitoxin [Candidatus Absconditabacteria bacterium]MDD3262219.1 type II toxin-antitoxin system HicB family antitoxin [Candidatus Absconditabacteria bacterium]